MNKMNSFIKVVVIFLLLNVFGCSNKVALYSSEVKYSLPSPPSANETLLYLFREDTIVGGAIGLTFVADDTVVATLSHGTFSYVNLPADKPYEIVAVMNENFADPKYHFRLDPEPGGNAYVMWSNALGLRGFGVSAIDEGYAEKIIKEYGYRKLKIKGEKIGVSYNEYFDKLVTKDSSIPVIDNEKIIRNRPLYDASEEQ